VKLYVGLTDQSWFDHLAGMNPPPDEINFWRPGGTTTFKAIEPGAPFLFKLHSPNNVIAGWGWFVKHFRLPVSLAWRSLEQKNGAPDLAKLLRMIQKLRKTGERDPWIGCTILTSPVFLPRNEWFPVPPNWASNIVSGRTYTSDDPLAASLWDAIEQRERSLGSQDGQLQLMTDGPRYGAEFLARARLGQGTFRILVTEAYNRRCAMTGEKTLPVLEAAHIQSYGEGGPHRTSNGLLLRSDLHTLFDSGYLTVSPDYRIEVSKRIHEEFNNGAEYYALHGKQLWTPDNPAERPAREFLEWHNEKVFSA
jgi:putative restriction endonuclease